MKKTLSFPTVLANATEAMEVCRNIFITPGDKASARLVEFPSVSYWQKDTVRTHDVPNKV